MLVEEYEKKVLDSGEETIVKKQRCVRTIHAEQNLLLFTDRSDREGATRICDRSALLDMCEYACEQRHRGNSVQSGVSEGSR